MTTYAALILPALLLLSMPTGLLKLLAVLWLSALLLLVIFVLAAWLAKTFVLPVYDPALHRLLQTARDSERR